MDVKSTTAARRRPCDARSEPASASPGSVALAFSNALNICIATTGCRISVGSESRCELTARAATWGCRIPEHREAVQSADLARRVRFRPVQRPSLHPRRSPPSARVMARSQKSLFERRRIGALLRDAGFPSFVKFGYERSRGRDHERVGDDGPLRPLLAQGPRRLKGIVSRFSVVRRRADSDSDARVAALDRRRR